MLCEVCQEREAQVFGTRIVNGAVSHSRLCPQCFDASRNPQLLDSFANIQSARCEYCGGWPCGGGQDFLEQVIRGIQAQARIKYMCLPCSAEYHRFIGELLEREEPLDSLREQVETHMKNWTPPAS